MLQPTLPLRGATATEPEGLEYGDVSTHAPLAGSDGHANKPRDHEAVSTHAPLAGSDGCGSIRVSWDRCFNPRSPCGERRAVGLFCLAGQPVSTHAPLAGSDPESS